MGLVQALFRARRAELVPRLRAAVENTRGKPFAERLNAFARDVLQAFEQRRAFLKVAIETEHLRPRDTGGAAVLTQVHDCLGELIRDGVSERVLEPGDEDLKVRALAALLKGVIHRDLAATRPLPDDASALVSLFLHGAARRR